MILRAYKVELDLAMRDKRRARQRTHEECAAYKARCWWCGKPLVDCDHRGDPTFERIRRG